MLLNLQSRAGVSAGGGAAPYVVATPPVFDGATDYMTRGADLTGSADSKTGIISLWFRVDGGDGTTRYLFTGDTSTKFYIRLSVSNSLRISARNAAGTVILDMTSTGAYAAGATWINVLSSWDLAAGVGNLYTLNADDRSGAAFTTNDSIDYTQTDWGCGGQVDGAGLFTGAICEVYFAPGQYLDISQAENRQKFITTSLKPVNLGSAGSTPTGVAPLVYFKNAYDTFNTNSGTGGNFSVTGTLTASATSPSD